jgi:hypothetical protein
MHPLPATAILKITPARVDGRQVFVSAVLGSPRASLVLFF